MQPGYYSWAYPSSMVSKYYCWFVRMGYPQLDIVEFEDGSWEICQYLNGPYIPCQTEVQTVLGPIENTIPTFGFCQNYVKQLDMHRKEFWDREEAATRAVEEEWEAKERHAEDHVERATQAITRNPGLMNRIAKKGLQEMDLTRIARHVPQHEYIKPRRGNNVVSNSSKLTD